MITVYGIEITEKNQPSIMTMIKAVNGGPEEWHLVVMEGDFYIFEIDHSSRSTRGHEIVSAETFEAMLKCQTDMFTFTHLK